MIQQLANASIGVPVTRAGITFFPVFIHQSAPEFLSGAAGHLEVTERPGAEVPTLRVSNKNHLPVLISEGETLNGGWQNRVVNVSVLVPAHSEIDIPVSCVEAGRWGGRREFVGRGVKAPRRVRRAATTTVSDNLRVGNSRCSDQSAVWSAIDRELGMAGIMSSTRAVDDLAERELRDSELHSAVTHLLATGPRSGQCGVVVTHGRRVVAADIYGTPALFSDAWEMVVRGYLRETVGIPSGSPSATKVLSFLERVSRKVQSVNAGVGLGSEYRLASRDLAGQALIVDDMLVHASAFALVA